jgi:hypothetical protein
MRGDNAGGKTFHIPGINSPWRTDNLVRPDGGIVTPNFTERKGAKTDFSWPNDEHERKSIPRMQGMCSNTGILTTDNADFRGWGSGINTAETRRTRRKTSEEAGREQVFNA